MAPGISYDDSGSLASYFGVTFLALILVPTTYLVNRPSKKATQKPLCPCSRCRNRQAEITKLEAKGTSSAGRFLKKTLPILLGWTFLAYLCYRIAISPPVEGETIYNPFEILGLSDSSTEKQIKKHYKKLSLQFHPDKIKLAENQTQEDADSKFVELTKAYKSLTDEVTRENLAKYGNPDGPQQREDKIAIPKWIVEGKNGGWVLAAYGLVLGGGIPFIVGRWWFSQRSLTRDGVLNPTAEHFFHYLREDTDYTSLVALLAGAHEFAALLAGKRSGSKKERKERQSRVEELEKVLEAKKTELDVEEDPVMKVESRVGVSTAVARRARALLWAQLLRVDLANNELSSEQLAVLRKSPTILAALLNIALAHNWLATSLKIIKLQAALTQALPPNASPLSQLEVSHEQAQELEMAKGAEGKKWLEKALKKDLLDGQAKEVAKSWPRLEVTNAAFKVVGENVVTPGAIVQVAFKARYIYPSGSASTTAPLLEKPKLLPNGDAHEEIKENGHAESVAEVEDEVEKVESEEDEKAPLKKELAQAVEAVKKVVQDEDDEDSCCKDKKEWAPNGYAHAPRWPLLRKPHFQVLLGDSKLDKVIVQPTRITDIPLPKPDGTPCEARDFALQFQAPPQPNLYSFVLHAASDTYLGSDVSIPIMLKVEEAPPEVEIEEDSDSDISDPEEDSLAGQMAMMRGGKVKPSAVHDKTTHEDSDSDGFSDDEPKPKPGAKKNRRAGKAINEDSSSEED